MENDTNYKSEIIAGIGNLNRRINRYILFKKTSVSVFFGAVFAIIFIIISKFIFIPISVIPVVVAIIGISVVVGIIIAFYLKNSLLETAIFADNKLKLDDRLGSAVEIINGNARKLGLAELQLEDTLKYIRSLDPKSIYPHSIPLFAKFIPAIIIPIILAFLIPSQYGDPKEARQIIKQVGLNIESSGKDIDKANLSDNMAKLVNRTIKVGRDLQNKIPTKKDALKNISQLNNQIDAMKTKNQLSEALKGEMTPEKKKLLAELMDTLMDKIADIPEMNDLTQKIMKAQQADLSDEAIKELIKAIKTKGVSTADINALQKLSDQLAQGKQDIVTAQGSLTAFRTSTVGGKGETEKGIPGAGDGAPGSDSVGGTEKASSGTNIKANGDEAELSGKVSKGSIVTAESTKELEKGTSTVEYENLYIQYKSSADETIARTAIPIIYRERVKNYFDAIKPKQ
jgi:hypothetical protein